jgi:hypothetical protein
MNFIWSEIKPALAAIFDRLREFFSPQIPKGKMCDGCGKEAAAHALTPDFMFCDLCYHARMAW